MRNGDVLETRVLDYLMAHHDMMDEVISIIPTLVTMAQTVAEAFQRGNKLFLFGNGGSAADAQHIAAEFVNRFRRDRKPLPAIALTTDSSVMTAIANDHAFDLIFACQIDALAAEGDVAIGITTSGKSTNVLMALDLAKNKELSSVLWMGANERHPYYADGWDSLWSKYTCLSIPSTVTSHIQEAHIVCGHILCDLVDEIMFGETDAD